MIQRTISTSNCHSERSEESAFSFGVYRGGSSPSPSVISSVARNLSYGLSGGFSGSTAGGEAAGGVELLAADFADGFLGFAQPEHSAAGATFFEFVFPAIKYLRIFSRRFGPSPRIASKSSTLLNAPYDFRICKIFSAVAGPIPGTCCNSSDVAVLMFTGRTGGFFFPASTAGAQIKLRKSKRRENRDKKDRHAMAEL
jgi:hypothetical protein